VNRFVSLLLFENGLDLIIGNEIERVDIMNKQAEGMFGRFLENK
jgi:hypothetical protein